MTLSEAIAATDVNTLSQHAANNGETCVYSAVLTGAQGMVVVRIARASEIPGGDPQRALDALSRQHGGHPLQGGTAVVFSDRTAGKSAAFVKNGALVIVGVGFADGTPVPDEVVARLAATAESRF